MRYQGKITEWKDEQGFGFITPDGGGKRVFVHIKSFSKSGRRPAENASVTYRLAADAKGRAQAQDVAMVQARGAPAAQHAYSNFRLILAAGFIGLVSVFVVTGRLPVAVLWFYLAVSAMTFIVYALDKSAAQNNQWRIQEISLHLFALVGGWPGALAAHKLLRHKSRKLSFQLTFWATVIIHCAALAWLMANGLEVINNRA